MTDSKYRYLPLQNTISNSLQHSPTIDVDVFLHKIHNIAVWPCDLNHTFFFGEGVREAGVRHSRRGVVKHTTYSNYMMLNAANTVLANCERKILYQSSEEHRLVFQIPADRLHHNGVSWCQWHLVWRQKWWWWWLWWKQGITRKHTEPILGETAQVSFSLQQREARNSLANAALYSYCWH